MMYNARAGNRSDACDLIDWEKEYDSIAVDNFASSCLNDGDACEQFRWYTEQEDVEYEAGAASASREICSDGELVCRYETYRLLLTPDGLSGGWCSVETSVGNYFCAPGYYGVANSASDYNCKPCPLNASCPGGTSFTCNSGYSANGDECCNSWTTGTRSTGGVGYKYRTCGNSSEIYHLYKCNEDRKYFGTIGAISCTWNDSTGTPTSGSCSGCSVCDTADTYQDLDAAPGHARVIHTVFSTSQDETYGTVGKCVTGNISLIGDEDFICAPNYYGVAQSNQLTASQDPDGLGQIASAWWGCTRCPYISADGTTNPATGATTAYPYVAVDNSANYPGVVNFGGTAGSYSNNRTKADCYASTGYTVEDIGDANATKFADESGQWQWSDDGASYNCYWSD